MRIRLLHYVLVFAFALPFGHGAHAQPKPEKSTPEYGAGPKAGVNKLKDQDFAMYVDVLLLSKAIAEQNASLLTDVGLQLAARERALKRPHQQMPAKSVLDKAVALAVATRDIGTLKRLAEYARRSGNDALAARVSVSQKLAGAARATDPALLVSVADTTIEQFALYRKLYQEIKTCRVLGVESLKTIEQELQTNLLTTKQKEYLSKQIDAVKKSVPKRPDATALALAKLTAGARSGRRLYNRTNTDVFVAYGMFRDRSSMGVLSGDYQSYSGDYADPNAGLYSRGWYRVPKQWHIDIPAGYDYIRLERGGRVVAPERGMAMAYFPSRNPQAFNFYVKVPGRAYGNPYKNDNTKRRDVIRSRGLQAKYFFPIQAYYSNAYRALVVAR